MRCYFHLVSYHDAIFDETGIEVTDLETAEAEALKAINELREDDSAANEDWQDWQLNVTDRSGQVLLSIPLDAAPGQESPKRFQHTTLRRTTQIHGLLIGIGAAMDHLNLLLRH
ncbi:hypothetical protein AA309_22595 [Microvirga vignae]|uniref:DUF6894 domain-containing protein n=2 Tax=Microvirga vignae TaxID=1225564 RepID=A0A0H1R6U9_9HYPH|nr:hypothetical protein AA309_22595 [Microvirga vignae]